MKNYKGITLIALVVTIIVLIILAGVSIIALTDDEKGVVTKAKQAKSETEDAKEQENEDISEIMDYVESEDWGNTTANTTTNDTTTTYYTVTFSYKNSSGTTVTSTATVASGGSVSSSDIPSSVEYTSGSYTYTFSNWVTTSGGSTVATLTNITANKTVYASYTSTYVCFVAGTKVLAENGFVNIEDVEVGMKVYSYNEETKEIELKSVKQTFINKVDKDMTKVTINGNIIESTSKHKYYEVNKGWIYACELEVGDIVLNSNNEDVVIENVETIEFTGNELNTVYNFEVEDNHNYFVGEDCILVHNNPSVPGVC